MPRIVLTDEQKHWLLTVGWKKHTLSQLAAQLKITPSSISELLKANNIEPMTKRDFIAEGILEIYNKGGILEVKSLSITLGCSQQLVKEIIEDFHLSYTTPAKAAAEKRAIESSKLTEDQILKLRLAKLKEREKRSAEIKAARAGFTFYNQTGSPLLDEIRGIKTTKRENTLLTSTIKKESAQ